MIKYFDKFEKVSERVYEELYNLLPPSRKERVDKITIKENKKIAIIEYFLVKKCLKIKKNVDFLYNIYGKPYIVGVRHFNISHSGNMLVVSYGDEEVGVDVQKIIPYNEKLANKICNEKELKKLASCENKDFELTKIWTQKESYIKLKGETIFTDLKNISRNKNCKYKTIQINDYIICECEFI